MYVGLDEWVAWGLGGAATATGFGHVHGDQVGEPDQDITHDEGVGGQDQVFWGLVVPTASIETLYKGEALLLNCNRTAAASLPPVTKVQAGVNGYGSYLATAYVDRVRVECGGVGEAVVVSYDWKSLTYTSATIPWTAAAKTAPFVWHYGAATINNAAYRCQSWNAELNNNLKMKSSLDVKAAGARRLPDLVDPGNEIVTCSLTLDVPLNVNLYADAPAEPIGAVFVIGNGYTQRTLTLRQLYWPQDRIPVEAGDADVQWTYDLESIHNSLAAANTAAWQVA